MWKLVAGAVVVVAVSLIAFAFASNSTTTQAGNFDDGSVCGGSFLPVFNPGNDPVGLGPTVHLNVQLGPEQDGMQSIQIGGPPPSAGFEGDVTQLSVTGNLDLETGQFNAVGSTNYFFQADVFVDGTIQGNHAEALYQIRGNDPGPPPEIDFQLECELGFSITVLKLNDATNGPIPDWGMELFANSDCSGDPIDSGFTNDDGIIDFIGLPGGDYSVLEQDDPGFEPDDGNLCREDIAVPGPSDPAALPQGVSEFVDCPIADLEFPDAGCDEFNSGAQLNVEFAGGGDNFTFTLSGPTTVVRKSAPQDVTEFPAVGSAQPAGGANGLDEVATEIVQLDLTGSGMFGDITLRESPVRDSVGLFEEQANDSPGEMDFPADSFFDVFAEVDITGFGTLHNVDPVRVECVITEIPPFLCLYQPPIDEPIDLFDEDDVLVARLIHAAHVPLPLNEVFIVFRNVPLPDEWLLWGDVNCSTEVDTVDGLAVLTHVVGFPPLATGPDCPSLGDPVGGFAWGDVNCNEALDSIDALATLQFLVGFSPSQEEGCLPFEGHLVPPTPTADIKVVSFGPVEDPPYSIGSDFGPVNGWWPDYFTFDEVKHNNGPDPAEVDVWWFVEDAEPVGGAQPNGVNGVFTSFRWHAQPGDICTRLSLPVFSSGPNFVPCGEGDVAGVPSINGDDCLDGQDNDGDTLVDFADPDCLFDIDDLHFTIELDVSNSMDLSRSLSVFCSGDGEFTFQTLNEQRPIDAEDPNLSNNEQAGEFTVECLPPI